MRRGTQTLGSAMLVWYALAIVITMALILLKAPHFSYSLDDSYIHLALAQNIAHLHYGINAGETVSPSSSVLWPFLLAPFSRIPVLNEWVALLLNIIFSVGTCVTTGRFLEGRMRLAGFQTRSIVLFGALLVLAPNLVGLTLIGMEHSLQVLLVTMCAFAILNAYEGSVITGPTLFAAALAPAVRYEDLAFTAAICGVLWLQRRRSTATILFGVSLLPLIALGLFLHGHHLPPFPNSVLAKGGMSATVEASRWAPVQRVRGVIQENARLSLTTPTRWPLQLSLLTVAVFAWWNRDRRSPGILVVALSATLAMLLIGPYGWFYRYDAAIRYFLLLLVIGFLLHDADLDRRALRLSLVWIFSAAAALVFVPALLLSPISAIEIARQQYEMHRFVHDFARQNVAVNDLGWVSIDSYDRFYVLDLYGLANNDALKARVKNAAWMRQITAQHHAGLVMVYTEWFKDIPAEWPRLGVLRQWNPPVKGSVGFTAVHLYATSPAEATELRPKLEEFRKTLPTGVWIAPE